MPMGLFGSSADRNRKKREKARAKRAKKYAKQQAKYERKQKIASSISQKKSGLDKALSFVDNILSIFSPAHGRFRHDQLMKQGMMLLIFLVCFVTGGFLCYRNYTKVEYQKAQAANFMTDDLEFSKTGTSVTPHTPFVTQDHKTIYIPLKIADMTNIDPDASEYHIFVVGKNGSQIKSKITQAQLISYGSTGLMYLVVQSLNKFQSEPVQFLIWSGSDITNDSFDPDSNNNSSLEEFSIIAKRYDTLGFAINLGGQSIKAIPKTKTITVKDTVMKKDPKTHKKVKVTKLVKQHIPITANKDLYNDNVPAFLYNHSVSGPQMAKKRQTMAKKYARMQLALNRIDKDVRALTKAGYILPKLPKWTTNRGNDIAKSLPFSYDQIRNFDMLNPNVTFTAKQQKLLDGELKVYKKAESGKSDDSSSTTKEEDYAASLANKVIKNKHVDKTLGNGNPDDDNGSDNDQAEWTELQNEVAQIATIKYYLYYEMPLKIWDNYQDFILATSSGVDKTANTGAITYSKLKGHNKHGNFMTIVRNPEK